MVAPTGKLNYAYQTLNKCRSNIAAQDDKLKNLYEGQKYDAITIKEQQSEIKALRVKIESLRVNLDKALNALDVYGIGYGR